MAEADNENDNYNDNANYSFNDNDNYHFLLRSAQIVTGRISRISALLSNTLWRTRMEQVTYFL